MKIFTRRKSRPGSDRAALAQNYVEHPHRSWDRRRDAAHRRVPLNCGCRDSWPCRCTDPPLSEHALDGWRDAANHVLASGRMPVVPLDVRRALYRRGGTDRELAETLHAGCEGAIA